MYTYNSADYYEWATVQLAPALKTVSLEVLGVGLGCWVDSSLNQTWNLSPESAEERVCKLMNESVQEVAMFVLSQGVEGAPHQQFPEPFWIAPLERFMRGETCDAKVPRAPWISAISHTPPPNTTHSVIFQRELQLELTCGRVKSISNKTKTIKKRRKL